MHPDSTSIPYGYCHCGCGEKTGIAKWSKSCNGWTKGQPKRFLQGHNTRRTPFDYSIDPITGCWNWNRAVRGRGYGMTRRDGITVSAHRAYWSDRNGPIPDGMHVCHRCDNPRCVNPDHLFLETPSGNMSDKLAKSREARGDHHGKSKLTESDVREIRRLHANGASASSIQRERFPIVSLGTICKIVRLEAWVHVHD